MPLYFIYWKSILTGARGRGKRVFTRKEAEDMVKSLNNEHKEEILHFVGS